MATVIVIIGRNVLATDQNGHRNYHPMPDNEWKAFKAGLHLALVTSGAYYFSGDGAGWSENWGDEPAHVAIVPFPALERLVYLRAHLAVLARDFHQDAITLMVMPDAAVDFINPVGGPSRAP